MSRNNGSRWLAMRVIDGDAQYGLSYIELFTAPDGDTDIRIEPFDGMERPSTKFYSGTIHIVRHPFPELIFR